MNSIFPIALLCLCSLVHAARLNEPLVDRPAKSVRELYTEFKTRFHKTYDDKEDEFRFKVFQANLHQAIKYNSADGDLAEYGITVFSDMPEHEFKRTHANLKVPKEMKKPVTVMTVESIDIPDHWDWRTVGGVTKVKDQGDCGSCWAFSATGNIEGQWYAKTGQTVSFSEQQLVDCDVLDDGCGGGLMEPAFETIERLGGIETESAYPYIAEDEQCTVDQRKFAAYVNSSALLPANETMIAQYLYQHGPISVAINADPLQYYTGGIVHPDPSMCDIAELDHAVLLVGYGIDQHVPYWLVKNSWGETWGESGYFRMYRGDDTCGIDTMAITSIIY